MYKIYMVLSLISVGIHAEIMITDPNKSNSFGNIDSFSYQHYFALFMLVIFILFENTIHKKSAAPINQLSPKQQKSKVKKAIQEFEDKASQQPILGLLDEDATNLLHIFKDNIGCIRAYDLKCDIFKLDSFTNKIHKIKLYDGDVISVTLHIFPENFKENLEYHNHSKHMLLQNVCGEYKHTTWRINTSKPGKIYKYPYDRNGDKPGNSQNGQVIDGQLEYVEITNYQTGNWKCLHPSTIHTITAQKNTQRIVSFAIKSKLEINNDRFILSPEPRLNIPTLESEMIIGEERENVWQYVIDSVNILNA